MIRKCSLPKSTNEMTIFNDFWTNGNQMTVGETTNDEYDENYTWEKKRDKKWKYNMKTVVVSKPFKIGHEDIRMVYLSETSSSSQQLRERREIN